MRTTIRIDDELYRTVRERAARSGRSIGEIIEDALRRDLRAEGPSTPDAALPTFAGTGVCPGVDLASNPAVREAMDDQQPLDALR